MRASYGDAVCSQPLIMKIHTFLLLIASIPVIAAGQKYISVSGVITGKNNAPVQGATIRVLNTLSATTSDQHGKFTLTGIAPGEYDIEVSAVNHAVATRFLDTDHMPSIFTITLAEEATQLDAVVVTAQKTEEVLQSIPLSISAINARQVRDYRLWNVKDLTGIVPNLYTSNSGDDRNVASIRGIGTTSYDPAVATYVDGVNQFSLDTYIGQLIDIERIEILRGPQGTLYGRNAMGGVINIITRQPTNTPGGFAEVNVGNYAQQRYSAGFRAPIAKNKLFLGVSAIYSSRDGFYTNDFTNSGFDRQHSVTGNYYLKFLPSKRWNLQLNVKHHNNRNNGAFTLVNGIDEALANPFHLSQDATATMIDNSFNGSLSVKYTGDLFTFTSQTAWQSNRRYYDRPLDGDFAPIDGVSIINDYGGDWNKVRVFTQELRFSSASSQLLKWTGGLYFFDQENPTKQAVHFGADTGLLGAPDTDFSLINSSRGKSTGLALFGQAKLPIYFRLELVGGLRFDHERKKYSVLGEYQKGTDPAIVTTPDTTASKSFSAFSPRIGLVYTAGTRAIVFVTYSRGFRTGGLTLLSTDPSQPPLFPFNPEYSNNLEAGFKGSWLSNRLRLHVTAFASSVTDAQVPTLILPDAITITRNAGRLRTRGVEVETAATLTQNLQVDYNFGFTSAKYKSLKLSQNGSEADLSGNSQVFTPSTTSMLAAQYRFPLGSARKLHLVIRGEWMSLGRQYFDLANTIKQDGYSLFNTRSGIVSGRGELMFWARNIGNKRYVSYAYDFGAIHLGDPRTIGVTLLARF